MPTVEEPALTHLMSKYKEGLICIGSEHLNYETGLLNLFFQEGFKVERVVGEEHFEAEPALSTFEDVNCSLPAREYMPRMENSSLILYGYKNYSQDSLKSPATELNITKNGKIKLTG